MGYHRAGFDEVVGVDMERRHGKRYPFEFVHGDALLYLFEHGDEFDAIAASPPCQSYSITKHFPRAKQHPQLIEPTRKLLVELGKPYVIENVYGARGHMVDPLLLCGSMFDLKATDDDGTPLRMERHRLFESNVSLTIPKPCFHDKSIQVAGAYGGGSSSKEYARTVRKGGYTPSTDVRAKLLGIDWMTQSELSQSIPPVYTEWIGKQLLGEILL